MICNRLRQFREYNGLSAEQLAEALGISTDEYNSFESNRAVPDIGTIKALARLYKVTLDEFYGYTPRLSLHSEDHSDIFLDDTVDENLLKLSDLSWDEKMLILKYRSLENKEKITKLLSEE